MMKTLNLLALVVFALVLLAAPAFAQQPTTGAGFTSYTFSGAGLGAGIGAAITILGAGYGFGKIGAAALESMARQPEVAPRVQTAMIIIGALLEGATFFSLIVCILLLGRATF